MQATFMPFRELPIGTRFRFGREIKPGQQTFSGCRTGVAVKTSARKYRYESDGMECRVSSIGVEVTPE